MNRLTAIGLVSLVAYGLLVASKYAGVSPSAAESQPLQPVATAPAAAPSGHSEVLAANPAPRPTLHVSQPARPRVVPSAAAAAYRGARDLKAFTDGLAARKATLTGDERYYFAKALEECQFAMNVADDLVGYGAQRRRQFVASLPENDPLNDQRLASYDTQDSVQRCAGFQGTKISAKEIEELYAAAARQGDVRAQARMIMAEGSKNTGSGRGDTTPQPQESQADDMTRIIQLLESHDPEAMLLVGQFLATSDVANRLRIGPNGETPEPSAFLGAFSIVACDFGPNCSAFVREHLNACAFGGYCNAANFEELYQNFMASPWSHSQALRYRGIIRTAIDTRNWALIGLTPQAINKRTITAQAAPEQQ